MTSNDKLLGTFENVAREFGENVNQILTNPVVTITSKEQKTKSIKSKRFSGKNSQQKLLLN